MSPGESSRRPSRDHFQGQNLGSPNALPLINSLPPELFFKVLGHLDIPIPRARASFRDRNWTIPYQLVCHRWRDLSCSTPQFWQEIEVQSRGYLDKIAVKTWQRIFHTFTSLRALQIRGSGTFRLRLPLARALAALFDLIPGVLRARTDAGGAHLNRFQLYLQYTDGLWSQTSDLHDTFVEDVKALVVELDYHDGRM
ncbi:hypothetical protein V8D89_006399 [Ganoderma adspersum]